MPVNSLKNCLVNSSVTHDIAKNRQTVYKQIGNNVYLFHIMQSGTEIIHLLALESSYC